MLKTCEMVNKMFITQKKAQKSRTFVYLYLLTKQTEHAIE